MATPALPRTFVMHGARAAMAGGLAHIEQQIKAIEGAVFENPGLAFDLARTLIESACKTILTERKVDFDDADDLPKLFKAATQILPFLPTGSGGDGGARKSLDKVLSGLSQTLYRVCELRNDCGFASHGKEEPPAVMDTVQAVLAAQAADAIVGFLYRVHRQERLTEVGARLEYDDHAEFNQYVDEVHEAVKIFGLEYKPSEVLFRVDQEAYRDALANWQVADDQEAPEATVPAPGDTSQ